MTEIRLDRDYYHLHQQIGAWCEEHFGAVDLFDKTKNIRWYRDMMFGYQTFTFHRDEDATFFSLCWVKR
jgi:hypothetical protein